MSSRNSFKQRACCVRGGVYFQFEFLFDPCAGKGAVRAMMFMVCSEVFFRFFYMFTRTKNNLAQPNRVHPLSLCLFFLHCVNLLEKLGIFNESLRALCQGDFIKRRRRELSAAHLEQNSSSSNNNCCWRLRLPSQKNRRGAFPWKNYKNNVFVAHTVWCQSQTHMSWIFKEAHKKALAPSRALGVSRHGEEIKRGAEINCRARPAKVSFSPLKPFAARIMDKAKALCVCERAV